MSTPEITAVIEFMHSYNKTNIGLEYCSKNSADKILEELLKKYSNEQDILDKWIETSRYDIKYEDGYYCPGFFDRGFNSGKKFKNYKEALLDLLNIIITDYNFHVQVRRIDKGIH